MGKDALGDRARVLDLKHGSMPGRVERLWLEAGGPDVEVCWWAIAGSRDIKIVTGLDMPPDGRHVWALPCWDGVDDRTLSDSLWSLIRTYADYFVRHHWELGGGPELAEVVIGRSDGGITVDASTDHNGKVRIVYRDTLRDWNGQAIQRRAAMSLVAGGEQSDG